MSVTFLTEFTCSSVFSFSCFWIYLIFTKTTLSPFTMGINCSFFSFKRVFDDALHRTAFIPVCKYQMLLSYQAEVGLTRSFLKYFMRTFWRYKCWIFSHNTNILHLWYTIQVSIKIFHFKNNTFYFAKHVSKYTYFFFSC